MVDTGDLKSPGSNTVWVRVPLRAICFANCEGEETTTACRFVGTRSEVAVDPATNRPEKTA